LNADYADVTDFHGFLFFALLVLIRAIHVQKNGEEIFIFFF